MRIIYIFILGAMFISGCVTEANSVSPSKPCARQCDDRDMAAVSQSLVGSDKDTKKMCPECKRKFDMSVKVCPYDGNSLNSL